MPLSAVNIQSLLIVIQLIIIIEMISNIQGMRAPWTWNRSVQNIYDHIAYDDDLHMLTTLTRPTWTYLLDSIKPFLLWPKDFHTRVAYGYDDPVFPGRTHVKGLSAENRLLRYFMFAVRHNYRELIRIFKQQKSSVYDDFKVISRLILHALGPQWLTMPDPHSQAYDELIGDGVFSDTDGHILFPQCPYITDVVSIPILRPRYGQRTYFNGHKHRHTADFMCVHDGYGRVKNVTGHQPGHRNDTQIASNAPIYTNSAAYLRPGPGVLADLAYNGLGYPYLSRIAFKEAYTPAEIQYNRHFSACRVISENFYGRVKQDFGISNLYSLSKKDIDVLFRAFCIIENIKLTIQSPLRRQS